MSLVLPAEHEEEMPALAGLGCGLCHRGAYGVEPITVVDTSAEDAVARLADLVAATRER